ncbi:alpha/beta hydrolase family protein [Jannaschia seohaensis]|uniref:Predicted dienelactone hydrolase n=1 Tax=Jannaschia seohaensis TaxID=475081 RepID=A0A2Y9B3T4_9RHOB|nr:alpha/beta fold hydrolase [Jannaschia seohaensis]PWJ14422.1 putative dienelactone hydrolase [Jannaschia seohaensis]SSA50148.1 Predicted dienelactone hydrolase [Jannaschia seohaensis]
MKSSLALLSPAILAAASFGAEAQNRIDLIRPDAPERAALGDYPVGVRTVQFTDPGRIDILSTPAEGEIPTVDRSLTVEIWYPAADGTAPGGRYTALLRDGETEVTLTGRAARDAAPALGEFPLVILSHGYPGNRFLMSHLGENLASKGFVVAAADHPDSTYDDQGPFPSTLYNRPLDQAFLLDAMAGLDDEVGAITDTDRTGIVGYSMGGYGALIFGGGGLSQTAVTRTEPAFFAAPQGLLSRHAAGSETLAALADDGVRAIVAIGPWGRNREFWDAEGLAGVEKPLFLVAGSVDDVSDYPAMRQIFEETTGVTRYLLTFEGANHNAAAPIPAPAEAWEGEGQSPFDHYADAVWDTVRMNNVLQHFATVFFELHLQGFSAAADYLDVVERAEDGVWDLGEEGEPTAAHSYWLGFPNRTAVGLRLEQRVAE